MTYVNGMRAEIWIEENRPENGLFRAYWKDPSTSNDYEKAWKKEGSATLDPEEGEGLRWEWYYKDGKRADGISKGWYTDGKLKQTMTWKDSKRNGPLIAWYANGEQRPERIYKDGIKQPRVGYDEVL